ncbi:hypothetical protein [Natronocalculus amylovorans]|uniref:Uncharacterized protein n=1 Tax=Natronocalculus amylovorans TaxID=2917812 RepID=A0AAE3FYJ4_9EURY|nr:hypothetical protein [Natronocalculus amylovorans]MCL9817748.1 hypothetical protein [Natronocalculus amylovorans]
MVSKKNNPSQSGDSNQITKSVTVSRRRAVQAGLITAFSLSGCLTTEPPADESDLGDNEVDSSSDEPREETTDDGTEDNTDEYQDNDTYPGSGPLFAVRTFLQAAVDEDIDQMSEVSHSRNPLDPAAWVEDGWEFRGGGDEQELDEIEMEVIDDDATIADVFELEGAEFWFEEEDLDETLDGEDLATVEVIAEDPTEDDMVWMMATEDGEWRYLFAAAIDDTPDDPEEAFEEPIEDENDDVVVEINWDHESATSDVPQAAVVITEERGVDANRIRIESTIEGASTEVFDRDDDEFTATWDGGHTLYIAYDTDGDQIVVTAIDEEGDESEVVHREHYEP